MKTFTSPWWGGLWPHFSYWEWETGGHDGRCVGTLGPHAEGFQMPLSWSLRSHKSRKRVDRLDRVGRGLWRASLLKAEWPQHGPF